MTHKYDIYLICPHALDVASAKGDPKIFFDLSNEVSAGRLTFADLVATECIAFSSDSLAATWISGARSSAQNKVASWSSIEYVMDQVENLDDPSRPEEQANPQLAALAWEMRDNGTDACVVTDDTYASPLRTDLITACSLLNVPVLSFDDYYPAHII